jgi:hypothetical protein
VARYEQGRVDVCRAWMGDTELGPRGEGMPQNLYVQKDNGELKVASIYIVCNHCMGSGWLGPGQGCPHCDHGWEYRLGIQWKKLGRIIEIRKLQEPSDPMYKAAYAAIERPA